MNHHLEAILGNTHRGLMMKQAMRNETLLDHTVGRFLGFISRTGGVSVHPLPNVTGPKSRADSKLKRF